MRVHSINYIPRSYNFSELDDYLIEQLSEETVEPEFNKEKIILDSIYSMKNDKQKVVFFIEILREYGYQLDCDSIAKAMRIKRRWYQRIKQQMKKAVQAVV